MTKIKKTITREIKQGKAAPVIETVTELVEDIKEEVTEPVGTITLLRWQVVALAAAITIGLIVIIL